MRGCLSVVEINQQLLDIEAKIEHLGTSITRVSTNLVKCASILNKLKYV